jgi:hypothetical protein
MARSCTICQHLKRAEIDRRLANGEPAAQVARAYELSSSSVYRHRTNCAKLAASNVIKKEAAQGSAARAMLPSIEELSDGYGGLIPRIDAIVAQAVQQGSLNFAISGLNSVRQTLDSWARLTGHAQAGGTQVNVAVQTSVNVETTKIAELLIKEFDHEPETKARIAQALSKQALLEDDDELKS